MDRQHEGARAGLVVVVEHGREPQRRDRQDLELALRVLRPERPRRRDLGRQIE
jgi:hypothetical protein